MPAPRLVLPESGTRVPKVSLHVPGVLVSMRNHAVVLEPFGLPAPFRMADVWVIEEAEFVDTVGGSAAALVVKDCTVPTPVPLPFDATAQ